MKKESRLLYVYAKGGVYVGFLVRGESFDRVYLGYGVKDFLSRLAEDPAIKQARRVFLIRGSEESNELAPLSPKVLDKPDMAELAQEIARELLKLLGEGHAVLPEVRDADEGREGRGDQGPQVSEVRLLRGERAESDSLTEGEDKALAEGEDPGGRREA